MAIGKGEHEKAIKIEERIFENEIFNLTLQYIFVEVTARLGLE